MASATSTQLPVPLRAQFEDPKIPFWEDSNYQENLQNSLKAPLVELPSYSITEQSYLIANVACAIFSLLCLSLGVYFPLGVLGTYYCVHYLIGKAIVLSSAASFLPSVQSSINCARKNLISSDYYLKRMTLKVNGCQVDTYIVVNPEVKNHRWTIFAGGNGEFCEHSVAPGAGTSYHLLQKLKTHGVFFNYPEVGKSKGFLTKESLVRSYKAVLTFVEDSEKGLGAREVISFGHSLGGGVQAEALARHTFKEDTAHIAIYDRTFSSLQSVINALIFTPLGYIATLFGWNLDCSRNLTSPSIVVQTATKRSDDLKIVEQKQIHVTDGVIPGKSSLANDLIQRKSNQYPLFCIPLEHNESWTYCQPLVDTVVLKVNKMLQKQLKPNKK